jgi:hypothetical protein
MSRSYLNTARLDVLKGDLSPKERAILSSLGELRLATASQLERLVFASDSARNRRRVLQAMTDRGLLTRLARTIGGKRAGSSGFVYALSMAGRRLLAQGTGVPVRQGSAPGAPFVAHSLAVTELAVQLHEAERRGLVDVLDFEGEPHCWRPHPGPGGRQVFCKPDAYVRLGIGEYSDSYFVELDQGTEAPSTLAKKMIEYRRYFATGIEQSWRGVFPRVVWLVPDEKRHQTVVDICSRQPAESWQLHLVTTQDNAIATMVEGAA